ncbi:MAG: FtsX-like permease family protein [Candidatus Thermoplasmatota archaeon]|nr:FtsX-like permease family protein [Candidatus Thermoplasmatota archaeon]
MWLLVKRLIRSQVRGGILSVAFLALVLFTTSLCVMLWEHSRNAEIIYDEFYEETNLADVVVESLPGWNYTAVDFYAACDSTTNHFAASDLAVEGCETRYEHREDFLTKSGEKISMIAYGLEDNPSISNLWFDDGWGELADESGEVVIDRHMQVQLGIEIGNTVTLILNGEEVPLLVTGIANHPHHLFYVENDGDLLMIDGTLAVVYLPIESLLDYIGHNESERNLMLVDVVGTPEYDFLDTTINEGEHLDELRSHLESTLQEQDIEQVTITDRSSIWSVEAMRQDLEGNKKFTPIILLILAGISALVISISLERLVRRQSREIAVLRAEGIDSKSLLISYLSIPAFYGVIGASFGIFVGHYLSEIFTTWFFQFVAGMPVVSIKHYPDIAWSVFGFVMLILVLFGLWPAIQAVRLSPLEVMRKQAGARPNRFVAWATSMLPPTAGLGFRSTFRNPRRLTLTVIALGVALILVSGMSMITEGMKEWIDESNEAETWDYKIYCNVLSHDDLEDWVEENQAQYQSQWALEVPVNATGDSRIMTMNAVEGFSTDGDSTMHKSRLLDGRLPNSGATPAEAVVDAGVHTYLDDWDIGEEVTIKVGITEMRFKIVGIVDESARSLWVHHEDIMGDLGDIGGSLHNVLYLRANPGIDSPPELEDIDSVISITDKEEMVAAMERGWESQQKLMNSFIWVGAAIAFLVLLNTLLIHLTEHDSEFATLRILGASSPSLIRIMMFEHLLIGIFGGIFGAIASILAAEAMGAAFSNWAFTLNFAIQWDIAIFTCLAVIVASLLVVPFGIFRIRGMDLVEKAKEYSE